jgi:hypothetical protein
MNLFQRSFFLISGTVFGLGLFNSSCGDSPQSGQAGFLSTDIRLISPYGDSSSRTENPVIQKDQVIYWSELFDSRPLAAEASLSAWRGERVHVQIVLKTAARPAPRNFSLKLSPLVNENGDSIPAGSITIRRVGEVLTDEFREGCGHRPDPSKYYSSYATDPLLNETVAEADSMAAFWVSIQVPRESVAGQYKTTISTNNKVELNLTVKVSERQLPPPSEWAFGLDLWQHPAAIARVHNVPLWSKEHYEKMRPYYEALAAAGQKKLTASIVEEPWGHQTYDDFPSLIKWIKTKDGSWRFDFSRFDEYVEFGRSCGINERINCYTIIPWKMQVRYYDEALGQDTTIATEMDSPAYLATWKPMLVAFTNHLKEKNWFDITTIAMDERPMPAMKKAIALLRSIDPNWKIGLAGDYHPEIEKDIYDYCVASRFVLDEKLMNARKQAGKHTTYYTCCVEEYPNGFTFSAPAEHVYLGWYAQAKGFDGYLRWAYNSWTKQPFEDSRFKTWPAGDTYQIYPGPVTSIRFEKLVEGVQDFEKIRILREEWARTQATEKLQKLDSILGQFSLTEIPNLPDRNIAAFIKTAKEELQKLEN